MVKDKTRLSPSSLSRMLKNGTEMRVRPLGGPRLRTPDVYHQLLRATWPRLTVYFLVVFFLFNCLFAGLFLLDPHGFTKPDPQIAAPLFWQLFFFSIETVATVGYGNMVPITLYANILVSLEISLGILFFALVTGIMFARFSRPFARVVFSNVAIIAPFDGVPTLMFRAANQRGNQILDAAITLTVARQQTSKEGVTMRRFEELKPVRERTSLFALSWTVMHRIDQTSPLFGLNPESCYDNQL